MDPNELLKAAPEVHRIVATIVAGVPIAEIVKRIVLPSADVLGDRMKQRVERCFSKGGTMILQAQATPSQPPDKIIIEILQGASLEEDEDLHTMWSALLANACSLEHANTVTPGFVAILRQMAPNEARLLKWMAECGGDARGITYQLLFSAQEALGYEARESFVLPRYKDLDPRLATCLDGIEAQQLIRRNYWQKTKYGGFTQVMGAEQVNHTLAITQRGTDFLKACQPPKPKEAEGCSSL
jgi:hypothetical protein